MTASYVEPGESFPMQVDKDVQKALGVMEEVGTELARKKELSPQGQGPEAGDPRPRDGGFPADGGAPAPAAPPGFPHGTPAPLGAAGLDLFFPSGSPPPPPPHTPCITFVNHATPYAAKICVCYNHELLLN